MKLLLAEDERSLSRAIVHILQKNNYTADAVYDGPGRAMAADKADRSGRRHTGFNTGLHAAVRYGDGADHHHCPGTDNNRNWLM